MYGTVPGCFGTTAAPADASDASVSLQRDERASGHVRRDVPGRHRGQNGSKIFVTSTMADTTVEALVRFDWRV
ncbi:MAG: hypothetical protein DMF90_14245 [Acidobacteria bacterium]|nr:MAG: hypothetical protein DMF90_14245 [Acidobacteriota bacterium]